jgi:dephospho-CoA kinase
MQEIRDPSTTQRVGLTGGIGSGKSTVAHLLVERGAALVDADAISRATTAAGGAAMEKVGAQFGAKAVMPDGAMNRDFMRDLIFSQPDARHQLEAIIHPLVGLESARQAKAAMHSGTRCIVFDIPLLVESGRWRLQLDQVLVIDCSAGTQLERVMVRETGRVGPGVGWTREAVQKAIAGQVSQSVRRAAADACIYNDGLSLEDLALAVSQLCRGFGL